MAYCPRFPKAARPDASNASRLTMRLLEISELIALLANPKYAFAVEGMPAVLYLNPICYEDSNHFLFVTWKDIGERDFEVACAEGVNRLVKVFDDTICLIDVDDNLFELAYAAKAPIPPSS